MKYRFCYPLLIPIRLLICLIALSNIICIFIGKRLSKDTPPPSAPPEYSPPPNATSYPDDVNYDNTAATEKFFPDSEQLGLNICLLAATLYMLYKPGTRFWWLTSNFRLTILSWGFAIAGVYYSLTQYIRIVPVNGGCGAEFFRYTRMRCWMQLGISASQTGWAVLLVWESFVMVKQKNDRKWNEQRADEELQGAVMYQPDLAALPAGGAAAGRIRDSLEYDDRSVDELELATMTGAGTGAGAGGGAGTGTGTGTGIGSDAIDRGHLGGVGREAEAEEALPEYANRRPRGQPLIVDVTHPPRRLVGAVARRMQSESATHTVATTASNPPLPSVNGSEPGSQELGATSTSATTVDTTALPPPPSYTP
ncbi:hypothetical protein EC957_010157 [Mortierella hygrophila]|uniref:Uncharacterized protein n=1 Tax=Mortierella hygrophila TaxID=979708 RepID=A0A9P6FB58_9FUNG|nr:hypothetical protein EC957_010157 [Mortierella hygrophila]